MLVRKRCLSLRAVTFGRATQAPHERPWLLQPPGNFSRAPADVFSLDPCVSLRVCFASAQPHASAARKSAHVIVGAVRIASIGYGLVSCRGCWFRRVRPRCEPSFSYPMLSCVGRGSNAHVPICGCLASVYGTHVWFRLCTQRSVAAGWRSKPITGLEPLACILVTPTAVARSAPRHACRGIVPRGIFPRNIVACVETGRARHVCRCAQPPRSLLARGAPRGAPRARQKAMQAAATGGIGSQEHLSTSFWSNNVVHVA